MTTDAVPARRLASFYLAYYAALGAFSPYWSLFLKARGQDVAAISLLMSLWYGTRIVAPSSWSWLAARSTHPARWLRIGCALALASFLLFLLPLDFTGLLVAMVVFCFAWNAVMTGEARAEALDVRFGIACFGEDRRFDFEHAALVEERADQRVQVRTRPERTVQDRPIHPACRGIRAGVARPRSRRRVPAPCRASNRPRRPRRRNWSFSTRCQRPSRRALRASPSRHRA